MKLVGVDWWALEPAEIERWGASARQLPGVSATVDSEGRVLRLLVHRSHLPVLPGFPTVAACSPPEFPPALTPALWEWLRPYQQDAVAFVRGRAASLISLDLGLGKTAIATAAAELPVLVLCPVSAISVWQMEAERMGWHSFACVHMRRSDLRDHYQAKVDCWIMPYSMAGRFAGDWGADSAYGAPQIHTLICDEFHACTNRGVSWAQAVRLLQRKRIVALTATPMRNRLRSLWGLLDALTPGAWGSSYAYRQRYCGAFQGAYGMVDGSPSHEDELRDRLSTIMLKRTRQDVGLDREIPPLSREVVQVPADHERLRAVVEAHAGEEQIAVLTAVRQEVGRQKLSVLLAGTTIDQWQAKYRRVVYWVWHKTMARLLADHLKASGIPVDLLVGDSPTAGRKRVVAEWQHGRPDDDRALVASIGAGSVAVNLTSARAAVFVEFAWDMLSQMQAEKRHHRFGNKHDEVHAIYCVLESTLDARMLEVLLEKAQHSEGTLGEDGQVDLVREVVGDVKAGDKSWLGF